MSTTPKQFGFIRTTLALWAANVGSFVRAGIVSDSPNGGNAWGINIPGTGWIYAAMRNANETFAQLTATTGVHTSGSVNADDDVTAGGGVHAVGDVTAGEDVHATRDITAGRDLHVTGDLTTDSISIGTPVTREAIMQSLPITNSAPGVVTVVGGGMKSFGFDGGTTTEELFYHVDVQHDYKAGTDMVFHVHWTPATATGGDVKWQIEYQWVEGGAVWPTPSTSTSTAAAGTTAWADKRADFTLSGTGHTYNSRLLFRLFRAPTDAADTYTGDAVLTSVGMHYQADIGQP